MAVEQFALGTRVRFHHRAAVARWMTDRYLEGATDNPHRWRLLEGIYKRERTSYSFDPLGPNPPELFFDWPSIRRRCGTINKTVMVWPEEGSGIVIGRLRRGRGTSVRGHTSYSPDGDDYEPGYFEQTDFFDLYALKQGMHGTEYILVPAWAVSLDA